MKRAIVFNRFDGGWSSDEQIGIQNSHAYSSHIDFRKKPSQMTVLPAPSRDDGGKVIGLVQNMEMDDDGNIYAIDDGGFLYKRDTSGNYTVMGMVNDGAYGLSFRNDIDKFLIASTTTLSDYSPVSNNPVIRSNKFRANSSTDPNASSTGGSEVYTLKTAVSEDLNNKREFQPDIEPLYSIKVFVVDAGTGDWTLGIYDDEDNQLATKTITNSNIVEGQLNEFVFGSQIRMYVKPNARTYHFHLTDTTGDGEVRCKKSENLNTCDYEVVAYRLIDTNNGMHPIERFLQYWCIGNGRYLSVWEPLSDTPSNNEWERHRLTFPANLEVCGLAVWNEYLAIACERRTTGTDEPQEGMIFFWDGLSDTYNYYIKIPEGSPYSIHENHNVIYYFAGGAWYAWSGGDPVKIRTMPNTDSEYSDTADQTIVYPYMATVRRGIHLLGFPSETTNQSIEHGIYSYGAVDKNFPDSFGLSYTPSHGTTTNNGSNNLRIGMIKSFGDKLFLSWRKSNSYGIDIVDNSSDPATTASWQSVFFEGAVATKSKKALYVDLACKALPTNCEITVKYRTERDGSFSSTTVTATEGETAKRLSINEEFYEIQVALDITCGSTTPEIHAVTLVYDDNREQGLA